MDDGIAFAGIAEHARMLRDREISSVELVELFLDRIESVDPSLNAFADVFPDEAWAAAAEADRRLAAGQSAPMLGVPVAIKDELDIAGKVARHGTVAYDTPARFDSEHVRRLRAAGSVIIGKSRLPELAITGFTESEFTGETRRGALERSPQHAERINRIFDDADILMTPVTGEPPVPVGKWAGQGAVRTAIGMSRTYPFTVVWNYTGQPAASIPAGFTEDGLPLGVMMIVAPNREELLLSVAAQLESALGWPDRKPPAF